MLTKTLEVLDKTGLVLSKWPGSDITIDETRPGKLKVRPKVFTLVMAVWKGLVNKSYSMAVDFSFSISWSGHNLLLLFIFGSTIYC